MKNNEQISSGTTIKMLQLPHKVCEYACPSVGLEDMYEAKTGVRLPDYLVMDLSMLGFSYIRQKKAPTPKMVFWGNGTGKPQHQFLGDVMGYQWTMYEGGGYKPALQQVIDYVEKDQPVILGLLDMYHIPYFKGIYHRFHIPYHYVLMVGYDLDKEIIYVRDNSRAETMTIPLYDLKEAWNVNYPGLGKKNSYAVIGFNRQPSDLETILRRGLKKRALWMLNPPVRFMGLSGLRLLAGDFPGWDEQMAPDTFKACLEHLVMATCSKVPNPPARLMPGPDNIHDPHQAVRDRFSNMLDKYGGEFHEPNWRQAAEHLRNSGNLIGLLTDRVVDFILGDQQAFHAAAGLLPQIADQEELAFQCLSQ